MEPESWKNIPTVLGSPAALVANGRDFARAAPIHSLGRSSRREHSRGEACKRASTRPTVSEAAGRAGWMQVRVPLDNCPWQPLPPTPCWSSIRNLPAVPPLTTRNAFAWLQCCRHPVRAMQARLTWFAS